MMPCLNDFLSMPTPSASLSLPLPLCCMCFVLWACQSQFVQVTRAPALLNLIGAQACMSQRRAVIERPPPSPILLPCFVPERYALWHAPVLVFWTPVAFLRNQVAQVDLALLAQCTIAAVWHAGPARRFKAPLTL